VDCIYDVVDRLYGNGGRYFVLLNLAPVELLPQYAVPEKGGLKATKFWPNKGGNITEISYRMLESVTTVNEVFKYRTPFEVEVQGKWKGARIANFDVNSLVGSLFLMTMVTLLTPRIIDHGYLQQPRQIPERHCAA
jgi:hypothetical protein